MRAGNAEIPSQKRHMDEARSSGFGSQLCTLGGTTPILIAVVNQSWSNAGTGPILKSIPLNERVLVTKQKSVVCILTCLVDSVRQVPIVRLPTQASVT